MIKKKLNILLLLSLALLFISLLGTTSLAYEPSINELKNFIWNYALYYGSNQVDPELYADNITNNINDSDLEVWLGYISRYQGKYVLTAHNGVVQYWCYTGTDANLNNHKPYYYNSYDTSYISVNNSYISSWVWTYHLNTNVFDNYQNLSQLNITAVTNTTANNRVLWFYTDSNIWNISYNSIVWNSGYMTPSNLFDGPYNDSAFDIDINADFRNNKATISNDTSGNEYYLIPYTGDKIRIGNMFDYSNLAGVVKRKFRYKQSIRDFELIQEFESNTNNLDYYSIDDDTLIVYEYFQGDTTEFITFIPKEGTGFSEFTIPIYFVTDNTRIVNGVIDGDSTFSGDYYSNYNNDTNTDKVIDNTNNGNDVDSILEETLSGDIENVSGQLGFSAFDNPFTSFLFFVIDGVYDILTQRGNVVLQANYKNYLNFRLESDDFITPNGALKTFIRDMLICVYIYGNYKYFHYLITLLETARINKFMAEIGTDEFYDTDIM